jgi:ribosomal protein S18 acetylase RimI-like enzyme
MNVRSMEASELEATARLWHETCEATYGFLPTEADRSWEDRLRFFETVIAVENELWVATYEGALAGLLAIRGDLIDRLYVHPGRQRRGVGNALLAQARALAPAGLRLFTHQENGPARAFYEKQGFVVLRLGTSPPPESAPDVEYAWRPEDAAG